MSNEPRCKACERSLMEMMSGYTCVSEKCYRSAEMVDAQGRTEEEQHADAIAPLVPEIEEGDATGYHVARRTA